MSKSNEPAFPTEPVVGYPGLTKREYFAGLAMQGDLARYINQPIGEKDLPQLADGWVAAADALLAELEKKL